MEATKKIEKQRAKIASLKTKADEMLKLRDNAPAKSNEWHTLNAGWNNLMDRYCNAVTCLKELTTQNA